MHRVLSLISVVMVVGCGPEPRNIETLQEVDGVYMNPEDGQPYSGPVFDMSGLDIADVITMTGSLKDGKFDGLYESYWENGQLQVKGTIKEGDWDGPYDGPYEDYRYNGQLFHKGTMKDGKRCGEWFWEGETVTYDPC